MINKNGQYVAPNYIKINGHSYNQIGDISSALTWTFVDEPQRNNAGQIENLNEASRFTTFRIWVTWKLMTYSMYLQFIKDTNLPEFTVEAFDYDSNEMKVSRMYLQKEEQKKIFQYGNRFKNMQVGDGIYQDGVEIKAIENFTIQLVSTNVPINTLERAVTYNVNGGSGVINNDIGIEGTVVQLSNGVGLTFPQKKLQSWNTKADGTGTSYQLGEPYYFSDSNLNLYAIWVAITDYVMALNYSGLTQEEIGTNPKEIQTRFNQAFNGLPTILVKTHYTFEGWFDLQYDYTENDNAQFNQWLSEGKIKRFENNKTLYPVKANISIFAKWLPNNYTINFNSNGGSNVNSITQGYNTYLKPFLPPSKAKNEFLGWYSDIACTKKANISRMTAPSEGISQTFYAGWRLL